MVTLLLGAIILLWAILAFRTVRGMNGLPGLPAAPVIPDADCPPVSILFSARDEAERLPQTLASLLTQDYPHYQVIAVDDRSSDATGRILDEFAAHYPHLNVIHLTELPPGLDTISASVCFSSFAALPMKRLAHTAAWPSKWSMI
jgi:cellulose synthase/poly-beta-1,6-N-acetylglucosamine synthase-like glycosyltransferase